MALRKRTPPMTLYALTLLLLFLSLGALGGGINLMTDPTGVNLGLSAEGLAGSVFADFFVPGVILFAVFGLLPLVALALLWLRPSLGFVDHLTARVIHEQPAWVLTFLLGALVIVWVAAQVLIIRTFHPLQGVMFVVGLAIALLALEPRTRRFYVSLN